jgi:hypothetical protein
MDRSPSGNVRFFTPPIYYLVCIQSIRDRGAMRGGCGDALLPVNDRAMGRLCIAADEMGYIGGLGRGHPAMMRVRMNVGK